MIFLKKIIKRSLYFFKKISLKEDGAVVLMYHSIQNNGTFFSVAPEEFEKQMRFLKDNNFNVISLTKLLEYLNNKKIPAKTVIITFDDGYKDNYSNAFPILKKYNFSATIFLVTGKIDLNINSGKKDLEMLDWGGIKEMNESGLIDIEPHTENHKKLPLIDDWEARLEIENSKKIIESNLEKKCLFFAYPFGRFSENNINLVGELDFKLAFTVKNGTVNVNSNLFKLNRNSVDSGVNFDEFKKIVMVGKI